MRFSGSYDTNSMKAKGGVTISGGAHGLSKEDAATMFAHNIKNTTDNPITCQDPNDECSFLLLGTGRLILLACAWHRRAAATFSMTVNFLGTQLRRPGLVILMVAVTLVFTLGILPRPAFAMKIKVKIGVGKIDITGGANLPISVVGVQIDQNGTGKASTTDITKSGSTDADGNYSNNTVNTDAYNSFNVKLGGETFDGLTTKLNFFGTDAKEYTAISAEEIAKAKAAGNACPDLNNLAGTDFAQSGAISFTSEGGIFSQFNLINTSSTSYAFTSLKLYKNLDMAFETQSLFDSPAAIASGTLDSNALAGITSLSIPEAEGAAPPELTFSLGPVDMTGYELLTGSARPILGGGAFGPETKISISVDACPEPSSLVLTVAAVLSLLAYARLRPRAASPE